MLDPSRTADRVGAEFDADALVNDARIQHVAPLERFDPERFAFMLRLMLEAPFLLTRAVLPVMYERGWGRIVHIPGIHGLRASAYRSARNTACWDCPRSSRWKTRPRASRATACARAPCASRWWRTS